MMTPTVLLILDGWGIAPAGPGNAPAVARTPHMDRLLATCAHTQLSASGRDVGLPAGYIGNSEVGHLNIGAGRVVYQDMTRIDMAVETGELDRNPVVLHLLEQVRGTGGRLHLAGLISSGGVHSHINHLTALARMATAHGVPVLIHGFMDGRDTGPHMGVEYLKALQETLAALPSARLATLCGRFYAMDRDKRWERVAEAWELLAHGVGRRAEDPVAAMQAFYAEGISDEFVKPTLLGDPGGADAVTLRDGDGLFFFNFRADRMRELVQVLTQADFTGFDRGRLPKLAGLASMTSYDAAFTLPVAFPKDSVAMGLGELVSRLGVKQLRIAETEKYPHVTYFFSGGREEPFPGEDRIIVPSPRDVPTYDLKPEMSARQVTDRLLEAWKRGEYTLVVCNLANGDMVGHTGVLQAAVRACEVVDECVGRLVEAVTASGGRMIIIADHGNCEVMLDENGGPRTSHTTNPVPCILVEGTGGQSILRPGRLADVAPTILGLWQVERPVEMTGIMLAEVRS